MTNYLVNYRRTRIPGYIPGIKPKAPFLFSPLDIAGLSLWLAADKETGYVNNDPVSSWTDFSGNNYDAIQATGDYQPLYKTNILNGKPAIQIDSTNDYLVVDAGLNIANDSDFAILIVYNVLGVYEGSKRVIHGTGNNWLMGPHQSVHRMYNGAFIEDGASDDTDFRYMLTVGAAGVGQSLRVNGVDIGSNANTTAPGGISIGTIDEPLNGYIPEVIIYNGVVLSGADITNLETYITTKYGL